MTNNFQVEFLYRYHRKYYPQFTKIDFAKILSSWNFQHLDYAMKLYLAEERDYGNFS